MNMITSASCSIAPTHEGAQSRTLVVPHLNTAVELAERENREVQPLRFFSPIDEIATWRLEGPWVISTHEPDIVHDNEPKLGTLGLELVLCFDSVS